MEGGKQKFRAVIILLLDVLVLLLHRCGSFDMGMGHCESEYGSDF